jgi:poly-gamma-glutamate synthesis protein (capsule biosynthesis protein)
MGNNSLTVGFVGDVYVNRSEPEAAFKLVKPIFDKCDILFGNLEVPITSVEKPRGIKSGFTSLKMPPMMVSAFVYAGFEVMAFAASHTMDWGEAGLAETIDVATKNGIKIVGAGRNSEEAHAPAIVESKGLRIAFLAYEATPYKYVGRATLEMGGLNKIKISPLYRDHVNQPDLEKLKDHVRAAKDKGDVVIVSFHWGESGGETVTIYQEYLGRIAIENGAHLVIGHHPHHLQAFQKLQDGFIAYSLGNFIFDLKRSEWSYDTGILECSIFKKGVEAALFTPANYQSGVVTPFRADKGEGKRIVEHIIKLCNQYGTKAVIEGEKLRFIL